MQDACLATSDYIGDDNRKAQRHLRWLTTSYDRCVGDVCVCLCLCVGGHGDGVWGVAKEGGARGGGWGAVSQLGTVSQPLKFLSCPILMYRGVLFTLSGSGCGKVGTGNRIAPDRTEAYLFTVLSSDQFMSEPHFTIAFCRGINSFRANQFVLLTQGPQEKSLADSLIKLKCSISRTLPLLSMNGQNLGGRPHYIFLADGQPNTSP